MISSSELIPWRDVGRWECVRCGKCCRTLDVSLSFEEEATLKNVRSDSIVYGKIGAYIRRVNGKCLFYDESSRSCSIYSIRPRACRLYPFYVRKSGPENARYGNLYVFVHSSCEGIGAGKSLEKVLPEVLGEISSSFRAPASSASRGRCSASPLRRSGRASCTFSGRAPDRQSSSRSR